MKMRHLDIKSIFTRRKIMNIVPKALKIDFNRN